jgi:hypothetical protein
MDPVLLRPFKRKDFAYRKAWLHTIYIATTGNDTTGNGSKPNPYKTFKKALSVAVAGDGILAADGTYAEAQGAGTSGYLWISKNLADWLVLEPEKGTRGNVTITGTVGTDINVYFAPAAVNSYLKFRYLKFGMCDGSTQMIRATSTAMTNIVFDHCTFIPNSTAAAGVWLVSNCSINFTKCKWTAATGAGYLALKLNTSNLTSMAIEECDFNVGEGNTCAGIYTDGSQLLGGSVTINKCTFAGYYGWNLGTGGTFTITNCVANVKFGCTIGVDGTGTQADEHALAHIINCTINKTSQSAGHVLLIGHGATNSVIDNVTIPAAYDYAVVIKENTGVEIKNCHLTGGSSSALYFKAAISANAHHNVLNGTGSAGTFQLRKGDSGNKCGTWQLQYNALNITEAGQVLWIGDNTHDTGGGVCDHNTYQNHSGLGAVRSDASVANLVELQAAWADYDVTTNDANSTVI